MATTPVVPTSAPAAPAAPVSTAPVSAPTATPTTPAPAAPQTTASPATGAQPSLVGAPPAALVPAEFANATEWYQAKVTYDQQVEAFKEANPGWDPEGETKPAEAAAEVAAPETNPAEVETKPTESETQADPDAETFTIEDSPSLTPQALNDLIKGDEALKAALEANPKAKNELFKMAREHAELQQFKGIFPSAESAKFAQKTATETVALKHQFQTAESPEDMARVFDSFAQQFVETGADGKPIIDPETGAPKLGEDYYAYHEYVIDRYADSTLAEVEQYLKDPNLSETDRERYNDLKLAASIIKGDLHPDSEPGAPDRTGMDPQVRAQIEAAEKRAKDAEDKLAGRDSASKKQSRAEVRTQGRQQFFAEAGKRVFQKVDSIVESLRKSGAVIPQWQLDTPVPGKNHSQFKEQVGQAIETALKADSYESQNMTQLELAYIANPTRENVEAWVAAHDKFINTRDHTGKSLINRIVTGLVKKYGAPQGQQTAETAPNASKEPSSSGPVRPVVMDQNQAWKEATAQLEKEVSGWENLDQSARMAQTMGRVRQILSRTR